jgi:large subunit ribosomal protein L5
MKDIPSLQKKYKDEVQKELIKQFNLKNVWEAPRITKITINAGLGEAKNNPELIEEMVEEMGLIAGQKPVITKAKKAISNFKIRAGLPIGVMVTLRKDRMWYFLDKLINIVLPAVKDFRGVSSKAFDGRGNYALGLKDHMIFPEIDPNKIVRIKPLQIIINTSTDNDEQAFNLLKLLGFPFKK